MTQLPCLNPAQKPSGIRLYLYSRHHGVFPGGLIPGFR